MSDVFAVVKDGMVINTIIISGKPDKNVNYGGKAFAIPAGECVGAGWSCDGTSFAPPPEPERTQEECTADAELQKQGLIATAQQSITLLQTKLLMGRKLTTEEAEKVNNVLNYIESVSAVDTRTAPDIEWPEMPA